MAESTLEHIGPAPRIAVAVAGRGPLVVFLHGIGGNRHQWRPQVPVFARSFRAAAWDVRGYGDSDDYPGPLSFADFTDDLERLLDHFDAPDAHLVGLSMGGRIARNFSVRFPKRVRSLVLANTSPGFDSLTDAEVEAFVRQRQAPLLAGKSLADVAAALVPRLLGPNASPGMHAELTAMMCALRKEMYLKTVAASVRDDRGAPLESLRVPTLVITSAHDRLYAPEIARGMAARIAQARLELIEDAGHLSNIEQPVVFNRLVMDFLVAHQGPQ